MLAGGFLQWESLIHDVINKARICGQLQWWRLAVGRVLSPELDRAYARGSCSASKQLPISS